MKITNKERLKTILEKEGLKYVAYYFSGNIISTMYNNDKMIFFSSCNPSMTLIHDDLQGIDFPQLCLDHIQVGQKFEDSKFYDIKDIDDLVNQLKNEGRPSVADFFIQYKSHIENFIK